MVLPGLLDNKRDRPEGIDRCRVVKPSAGKIRFVDVARSDNDDPQDERTQVVVWTLDLSSTTGQAVWENQPRQTSLGTIWGNDTYVRRELPREVPVLAFVHPSNPDEVYFFLEQHVFSVDVNCGEVRDCAQMLDHDALPRPITQHDVLAWVRPIGKFKTASLKTIYDKNLFPLIVDEPDPDNHDGEDVDPEGGQQPSPPSTSDLTSEDQGT